MFFLNSLKQICISVSSMSTSSCSCPTPDVGVQLHNVAIFPSDMRQLPGHCVGLRREAFGPTFSMLTCSSSRGNTWCWEIPQFKTPKNMLMAWTSMWLIIACLFPLELQICAYLTSGRVKKQITQKTHVG